MAPNRREFLRAAGIALGGTTLSAGAVTADETAYDTYRLLGQAPAPGAEEAVVEDDWGYVATAGGITTVDLSDPSLPVTKARVEGEEPGDTADVKVAGDVAGLSDNNAPGGVTFFDVSNPTEPTNEGFYRAASTVHNLFLQDRSEDPDATGEGRYAYLTITDDFAYSRMVIVDVDDPENPESLEGEERGSGGAWMLRDAQPEMAKAGINPLHDIYVQGDLAYLAYWDAGVVVVDVSDPDQPVAVGHFGAAENAGEAPEGSAEFYDRYLGGEKTNAHYVQPTPDGDYTFVGAETFPGPGEDVGIQGDHGGIRVFDTSEVQSLDEGGQPIYPEVDLGSGRGNGRSENADPTRPHEAYIPAPDQPDDAALTSHNFDVTETKLFTSWYQGGIRAYDIDDPTEPRELAAFAPDGMAFWTAENLPTDDDSYVTVGSDIGKGLVVLELTESQLPNVAPSRLLD